MTAVPIFSSLGDANQDSFILLLFWENIFRASLGAAKTTGGGGVRSWRLAWRRSRKGKKGRSLGSGIPSQITLGMQFTEDRMAISA